MPLGDWIAQAIAEQFDVMMPWDLPEPSPQDNAEIIAEAEKYLREHTAMRDVSE